VSDMHKCPKCGCQFDDTKFVTVIVDETMPKNTVKFVGSRITDMSFGDMAPVWYDGKVWTDWGAYCKRRRELGDDKEKPSVTQGY